MQVPRSTLRPLRLSLCHHSNSLSHSSELSQFDLAYRFAQQAQMIFQCTKLSRAPVQVPRLQETGSATLWGKLLGAALGAASDVSGGGAGGADDDVQEFDEISGAQLEKGVDDSLLDAS